MRFTYHRPDALEAIEPSKLKHIALWICRAPLETPVETSFGVMHSRLALFLRLEDDDGAFGFGEVWCNFPACGAEHRANLLTEELAPLVLGRVFHHPSDLFCELSEKIHIRALQAGELGPYAQVIAGLDIAMWDLFARKAGLPVRQLLNPDAAESIPAYASGIHIQQAERLIPEARAQGFRAFKVKVGFDLARDVSMIAQIAGDLRDGERLFADANQAWDLSNALAFVQGAKETELGWIEEPLAADAPLDSWQSLANASPIPLAAGENIAGFDAFAGTIDRGILTVIQPDLAKWGGFSGCWLVARDAIKAGRLYCPHYLGGGIGLRASAHLLAAIGGEGLLEIDVNQNPLRRDIWDPVIEDGCVSLGTTPGLGIEQLSDDLRALATSEPVLLNSSGSSCWS